MAAFNSQSILGEDSPSILPDVVPTFSLKEALRAVSRIHGVPAGLFAAAHEIFGHGDYGFAHLGEIASEYGTSLLMAAERELIRCPSSLPLDDLIANDTLMQSLHLAGLRNFEISLRSHLQQYDEQLNFSVSDNRLLVATLCDDDYLVDPIEFMEGEGFLCFRPGIHDRVRAESRGKLLQESTALIANGNFEEAKQKIRLAFDDGAQEAREFSLGLSVDTARDLPISVGRVAEASYGTTRCSDVLRTLTALNDDFYFSIEELVFPANALPRTIAQHLVEGESAPE